MTEFAKKTGKGFVATVIAVAAAFGGGVLGASFQAGVEHQAVAELKVKTSILEEKADKLVADDSDQRQRIAAMESTISVIKDVSTQLKATSGDLAVIQGQMSVILQNLPVSSLKMKPRGLPKSKSSDK